MNDIPMNSSILPICIYHRFEYQTSSYWGLMTVPEAIRDKTTPIDTLRCAWYPYGEDRTFSQWSLAGTFYAISPSLRPIPVGMRVFCAKKNQGFPYDTMDVSAVYDPFNIKDDCVYFTTYNQPVPNTVPLYFHVLGKHTVPSFDPNPPSNSPNWSQAILSPIFVMTKETVGDIFAPSLNNRVELKFRCVNGRCLPWPKGSDEKYRDMYDDEPSGELLRIEECVLYCNELVPSGKDQGRPFRLVNAIAAMGQYSFIFPKVPFPLFTILVVMFLVIVTAIITTMLHKPRRKRR